jgi:cytochrome-b5 reductase
MLKSIRPFIKIRSALLLTAGIGSATYFGTRHLLAEKKQALDPNEFVPFELAKVEPISHNTKKFTFKFDDPNEESGLSITSCVITKADIDGKPTMRPYTPVNRVDDRGHLDFVIKYYDQGVMSKHIHSLKPGDKLLIKGPIPKYPYTPNSKERIGFLAGGTGITPCYQLIRHILENPNDKTQVRLVYANNTPEDILLKKELDEFAKKYPDRFKVKYYLSKKDFIPKGWKGGAGYFDEETINQSLFDNKRDPKKDDKTLIMVCGPPRFMEAISGDAQMVNGKKEQGPLKGLLKDLGFKEQNVFKF